MEQKIIDQMLQRAKTTREKAENTPVKGRCIGIPLRSGVRDMYFYRAKSAKAGAVFVLHGGGFLFGSARNCEPYCLELQKATNRHIIAIDYTTSDVSPYPIALNDVCDAVEFFIKNAPLFGIDTDHLAIAGHSAGANLAAACALALKEGSFDYLVLNYPYIDQTERSLKAQNAAEAPSSAVFKELYCPKDKREDALVSPLYAAQEQLCSLPQTLVFLAEDDVLRYEGECFASRLEGAGKLCLVNLCKGMQHAFIEHEFDLIRGESDEKRRAAALEVIGLTAKALR